MKKITVIICLLLGVFVSNAQNKKEEKGLPFSSIEEIQNFIKKNKYEYFVQKYLEMQEIYKPDSSFYRMVILGRGLNSDEAIENASNLFKNTLESMTNVIIDGSIVVLEYHNFLLRSEDRIRLCAFGVQVKKIINNGGTNE